MPETNEKQRDIYRDIKKRRRRAGACIAALPVIGAVITSALHIYAADGRSGDVECWSPLKEAGASRSDSAVVHAVWNVQNRALSRAKDIATIFKDFKVDSMGILETNRTGALAMRQALPEAYVCFGVADGKWDMAEGGFGNALISRYKPQNIVKKEMSGLSMQGTIAKTFSHMPAATVSIFRGGSPLDTFSSSYEEDRLFLSAEVPYVDANGNERTYEAVIGHSTAHPPYDRDQREESARFTASRAVSGRTAFICMDSNPNKPNDAILTFAKRDIYLAETGPTSLSGRQLDFCGQNNDTNFYKGTARVLEGYMTDHNPVVYTAFPRSKQRGE